MAEPAPPAKRSQVPTLLVMLALGSVAGAAGFVVPMFMGDGLPGFGKHSDPTAETTSHNTALIDFGEVSVNLSEERLTRYLRVKVILVVDAAHEEALDKQLQKQKPMLKNWLIGHLSDKKIEDVRGAVGYERVRREIRDQFNNVMCPDGSEKIRDVLFEEFLVQ